MADAGLEFLKLKLDFMEHKYGVRRGGHRFWLFVLNCLASLFLFCVFCLFVHWVFCLLAVIGCVGVVLLVDVVKVWNKLVAALSQERGV